MEERKMRKLNIAMLNRKTMLIIVIIVLSILSLDGCTVADPGQNPKLEQVAPPAQITNAVKPLSPEDFIIGNYGLGISLWLLQQPDQPKPLKQIQSQSNIILDYGALKLTVSAQNRVVTIVTDDPSISTSRGIHPGSSLSEVTRAYGDAAMVTGFGDYTLYEYTFSPSLHPQFVLRFAVKNGTETVDYLGSRILDEDQIVRTVATGINPEDVSGLWWTDFGSWAFKLTLKVVDGELVGIHSGFVSSGRKMEIARINKPNIRGVFNNSSPVNVRFITNSGVEGNAQIIPLNQDCIWWRIISIDKTGELYIPHEAVLYRGRT
jgi:hypothetical protein